MLALIQELFSICRSITGNGQLSSLADGLYRVVIDADLAPGHLSYGELVIEGQTDDTVLSSCHVCHPSLANDNLSGIAVATRMGETKTPIFAIIRCAIRNPVRLIGQAVEMRVQLGKRHDRIDWQAVLDNVEVVGPEMHDARAVLARDISIADVPLARRGPIKEQSPLRNLIDSERDIKLEDRERLPHAAAKKHTTPLGIFPQL
jgi:hypothetical protein